MKRLRIRWERRDDIHEALLGLATCIITWRHVTRLCQDFLADLDGRLAGQERQDQCRAGKHLRQKGASGHPTVPAVVTAG
jgi:hypothetical protein